MKFFGAQEFFYMIFYFKNGCKNEFKDKTKNHAADPEIEFLAKSISKSNGCATAMPTAWELKPENIHIEYCLDF